MAVDVALAKALEESEGVLRIYRWARPTPSLGRNQPARDRYDPSAIEALGGDVVRRPSGGREVMHDRELTYSVILPLRGLGGLRQSYVTLNQGLVSALRSLGVNARLAPRTGRPPGPEGGDCFKQAAEGEVEVDGRKLVGSAQARIGHALLQHGSILLAPPSISLESLYTPPADHAPSPGQVRMQRPHNGPRPVSFPPSPSGGITLSEACAGPIGFPRLSAAVEAAMAGCLGGRWAIDSLRDGERSLAESLLGQYRCSARTWAR